VNIIAGITGGVDGIELGGLVNMNRYTMTGLQGSGFGNIVNGNARRDTTCRIFSMLITHIQMVSRELAFINVVNNNANIIQASGFSNVINGNYKWSTGCGLCKCCFR
jgi:hypothetical protein